MIVYCCSDLIFATKIRSTAESLGLTSRPARDRQALQNRLDQVDDGKANQPVTGVLIDLDLGADALALIEQIKSNTEATASSSLQTIPVVAFGSHVATELLEGAKQRGADFVLPRSSFTANLPDILQRLGTQVV